MQAAFRVSADGNSLENVLVNLLIAGFLTLALIGLIESVLIMEPAAWVQPVATLGLAAWAWIGKRLGRPQPIPLLLVSATLAAGFLVASAFLDLPMDATNSSPIIMMVAAGAIALVAGGRRPIRIGAYVAFLAAASVTSVQVAIDERRVAMVADVVTSVVVMLLTYYLVRSVWVAYEVGTSRYIGLIESAPVAVLEADLTTLLRPGRHPQPLIRDLNTRARRLLGLGPGDVTTIRHDEVADEFHQLLTEIVTSRAIIGERVVEYDGRALIVSWKSLNRTFNRVIFSAVDITAQRRAEESLAEQVRSKDQFIATVSHELRTPLTGILGLLEILIEGDMQEEEAAELMHMALGQTHDMADIVQDLLVAARASAGGLVIKPEPTDLHEVVQEVLAGLSHEVALEITSPRLVMADPVRVRQIVRNLATNAVRYGGPSRRVVVSAQRSHTTVEVRDNGPRLPEDFQSRMFEPYERSALSDLPTESVGLGLTVARTLAQLMNGNLTYHHDGRESVFTLSLPQAAHAAA